MELLTLFLLVVGFIAVIKGADFLVDGASSLARRMNVSDLAIGLTIVAFGTSMPELIVNIFASIQGNTDIAIGNILGSNIANILLILGIAAIIYPLKVTHGTVWKEIPLSFLAAVLLGVMVNDTLIDKTGFAGLTRIDGIVFISFFIIFMYYVYAISKKTRTNEKEETKEISIPKSILLILLGIAGLAIGGKLVVDGAVSLALSFGVSQSLIGLTVVALGTSLPELATSAVAAYKKKADIAVGNVVGSNIFNIFFVLGISSIIKPLPFGSASGIDVIVTILASFILFITMFTGKKRNFLERWEGVMFLLIYIAYIVFAVIRG